MNYRAGKYNSSGYLDMTAYLALRQVQREERAAKRCTPAKRRWAYGWQAPRGWASVQM